MFGKAWSRFCQSFGLGLDRDLDRGWLGSGPFVVRFLTQTFMTFSYVMCSRSLESGELEFASALHSASSMRDRYYSERAYSQKSNWSRCNCLAWEYPMYLYNFIDLQLVSSEPPFCEPEMEKAMAGSSSSKPFEKPCQLTVCGLLAILLQMRSA